jgi:serine phosphatase RsbU (regulator of sigma subunit)
MIGQKWITYFLPGIRAKLILFTFGLLFTFGTLSFLYLNYKENKRISEVFEKEIQAPLSYINTLTLDINNLSSTLILSQELKQRINKKGKELAGKKIRVSKNNQSIFSDFFQGGRNSFYRESYFSQYLSEKEINQLIDKIRAQFRDENGLDISDSKFQSMLNTAARAAGYRSQLEELLEIQRKEFNGERTNSASNPGADTKETNLSSPKFSTNAGDLGNPAKRENHEKKLNRAKSLLSREERILRQSIQNFFQGKNRDQIEELGFNPRNVRIQSYDTQNVLFLDTGRILPGSSFSSRRLLTWKEFEANKNILLNFNLDELTAPVLEKSEEFELGKNRFEVISKPFFKNTELSSRARLILMDQQSGDSEWISYLREDFLISDKFQEIIDQLRERREVLFEKSIPPYKDLEYKKLYQAYFQLVSDRASLYQTLHPYPEENKKRREDILESIKGLEREEKILEAKIETLRLEAEKFQSSGESSKADKNLIQAENLGTDLENLREEISHQKTSITSWNEHPRLKLAEAYANLREAALLSYIHLPYQNNNLAYEKFLRDNEIFNSEHRKWKHIRSWIREGKSETEIPDLFLPGLGKTDIFPAGILARSRMEAEEYMWKLDSTPLYAHPETDKSLAHLLLQRNVAGTNLIFLDRSESFEELQKNQTQLIQIAMGIGLMFLIIAAVASNFAVKNLRLISRKVEEVGSGNLSVEFPDSGWDEIGTLSRTLNSMVEGLKEREELQGEIQAAAEIQKRLLPETLPNFPGWEFGSFYKPMNGVGGDYFDFIRGPNPSDLFICIADVSNHGVGPALVMATVRSQLQALIRRGSRDPKKILLELNAFLYLDTPDSIFVTLFLGLLNIDSGEFFYISAGHMKPVIFRSKDQKIRLAKAGGLPLGMDENSFFETTIELRKTQLEPGDIFFQYTDGLTESMNRERTPYGLERLTQVLVRPWEIGSSVSERITWIAKDVEEFTGNLLLGDTATKLEDDMAMILIRRKPVGYP